MAMTAKEYLGELGRLDTCIEQKTAERQALYSTGLCAAPNRERVLGSTEDRMPDVAQRLTELGTEIDQQIVSFLCLKHTIIDQIQGLKHERHITVLYKRYVEYQLLGDIADAMNYAYPYIRRLHGHALQEFGHRYATDILAYEDRLEESTHRKEDTQRYI